MPTTTTTRKGSLSSRGWAAAEPVAILPGALGAASKELARALSAVELGGATASLTDDACGDAMRPYAMLEGTRVAVVRVGGPMFFNTGSLLAWLLGWAGPEVVGRSVLRAACDDGVDAVLLDLDCPGGSIAGMAELVEAVQAASGLGVVTIAAAHEMAASSAMVLAAACDEVVATETSVVGSVAAAIEYADFSGVHIRQGAKIGVKRSGRLKQVGPVDDALLGLWEEQVQTLGRMIVEAVAMGRGLDPEVVRGWEGRTFTGAEGARVGLVDRVVGWGSFLGELAERFPEAAPERGAARPRMG